MNALTDIQAALEAIVHNPDHWVTQADLQEKAHDEQLHQEARKTQNLLDEITKIKEMAKEKVSLQSLVS